MAANKFAQLLRRFRRRVGLSQNALAKKADIDPSYLNRLERGLRPPPTRRVVQDIALALDLDSSQTDQLLLSAEYAPVLSIEPERQVPLAPAVQLFAEILDDDRVPQEEVEMLKQQMRLIRRRYSRE